MTFEPSYVNKCFRFETIVIEVGNVMISTIYNMFVIFFQLQVILYFK